jgi:hypothetical protein
VIGCAKLPNNRINNPVDHHQSGAHGCGKRIEHFLHDLDVAELAQIDPGRQVPRRGQTQDGIKRLAERMLAREIGLDCDTPSTMVAIDGGRGRGSWRTRRWPPAAPIGRNRSRRDLR